MAETKREDKTSERADEMFKSHPDLQNREDQAANNPGSHDSIDGYNRSKDGLDDHPISAGVADAQNDENTAKTRRQEENPMNYSSSPTKQPYSFKAHLKKRGPLALIVLLLGGGGGMASVLFGTSTLMVNLMENLTLSNDSSSTAMERRLMKVLGNATQSPLCKSKKMKCKMGKLSNSALKKLNKKGLVPMDGKEPMKLKRLGYPSKNPTHYMIGDKRVAAKDLIGFLTQKENRDLAYKVMGRAGVFNMRVKAWTGKHITKNFYNKFKILRNGGIADGKNKGKSSKERAKAAQEKLEANAKKAGSLNDGKVKSSVRQKVKNKIGGAKKGGTAYLAAASSCILLKAPKMIAAGVAAIQLAQLIPVVMDTVLSPGAKQKANAAENTLTAEDVDTVGTVLTEKTPREGDGKETSALDSPYLLAAMGVNTGKPSPSKSFAPGLSLLSNSLMQTGLKAEKKTESTCNVVLSPAAMYTAAGIDAAATVALSATVVGGIIKVAASWAIGKIAEKVIKKGFEKLLGKTINNLAENDKIPGARGEALGDVIGVSAPAFFSAGGMSHHLPALKQSQLVSWSKVQQENESFNREMEIATLSPFDTSSRYTFLGSIIYNAQMATLANSNYSSTFTSLFAGIRQLSFAGITPNVSAATNYTSNYCGYSKDFYVDADIAMNMAGLPCTGITTQQASMTTEKAIDLLIKEGWVDDSKEVGDGDSIDDLKSKGVIKKDTPLYDYIEQCGDASSGDYLFNAPGCTISCTGNCGAVDTKTATSCFSEKGEKEGETVENCGAGKVTRDVKDVKNARALEAIPVFLLDYQILQSVNGEDEEDSDTASSPLDSGGSKFRIATFNLRGASHTDGKKIDSGEPNPPTERTTWKNRAARSVDTITSNNFDIIAFQEFEPVQREYMDDNLADYGRTKQGKQSDGIMWNKDKFQRTDDGTWEVQYFGKTTTEEPWVKLKDKSTEQEFYVMSVHDPINNSGSGWSTNAKTRSSNARKHLEKVKELSADAPVMLLGDFNSSYKLGKNDGGIAASELSYCILTKDGVMNNALDLSLSRKATCPQKKKTPKGVPTIDHIYLTPGLQVSSFKATDAGYLKNGSDHPTVYADLVIPSKDGGDDDTESSTPGGSVAGDDYNTEWKNYNRAGVTGSKECVDFVKFRLVKHSVINRAGTLGNGKDVVKSLGNLGFKTGTTPQVNSVFSTSNTSRPQYGHTGMVSKVNKDGSIVIEEYNYNVDHGYGTRTVTMKEYQSKGYTFAYTGGKYK